METLNDSLFLWINAPAHPNQWSLLVAIFLANWLIGAIPALIAMGWLKGREQTRKAMLLATVAAVMGLLISRLIGLVWFHPRPFMIDLGHTFMSHAADASFPSDHLTLWWTVAISLANQRRLRRIGSILVLLGIPIAWARIYLGVHFPFDMVGAVIVAAVSSWLALRAAPLYLDWVYRLALSIHCRLFKQLIERGWVSGV